jgi:hypothetical protein
MIMNLSPRNPWLAPAWHGLHPCQKLPVIAELVLPVAIAGHQTTVDAPATKIQPPYIIALTIERHPHRDLEDRASARVGTRREVSLCEVLVAIPERMGAMAVGTHPHGHPRNVIHLDGELAMSTRADSVGELLSDIAIACTVVKQFGAEILLGIAVAEVPLLPSTHGTSVPTL